MPREIKGIDSSLHIRRKPLAFAADAVRSSYRSMISQHIRPKWGDSNLKEVRPTLVQDWLRKLDVSPKYKGHIRSLLYRLFDKAMLWELLDVERNPMELVEVKGISKRKKRPRVLQVKDAWQILDVLAQPYRTIVLIALCFGLRISEILGLRWTDFDFKRSVVLIQRSAVGKRLNKLKTEYSQDEVPIERGFILELKKWQALCLECEGRWLFPSPVTGRPYHADSIRADYLVPTGLKLGLGRIGFHTFRHYAESRNMPHRVLSKLGSAFKTGVNPLSLFGTHAA